MSNQPLGTPSLPAIEGLNLLRQAYNYALDVERDPWAFAVEIATLLDAGMTSADLRWLVCKEYVQHAREIEPTDQGEREFRSEISLKFSERSCFRLTTTGIDFLQSAAQENSSELKQGTQQLMDPTATEQENGPRWDGMRHQFCVNGCLVKEFKVPSPNQQTILAAFQEDGWPNRIDDPLSQSRHTDGKRRLHDTIKSLNRNQKAPLIRFMGDGTGEGVRWELVKTKSHSDESNGSRNGSRNG